MSSLVKQNKHDWVIYMHMCVSSLLATEQGGEGQQDQHGIEDIEEDDSDEGTNYFHCIK